MISIWTASCRQEMCSGEPLCKFYWVGAVGSMKQCWFYWGCETLHRQLGIAGTLFAWEKEANVCRVANADACWHVTKRRQFLGAFASADPFTLPDCLHQNLFMQCDQKLMLGGIGVDTCGQCKYVKVDEVGNYAVTPHSLSLWQPPVVWTPLVGDVDVISVRGATNAKVFTDRDYTFTTMGDYDRDCFYLRLFNEAKSTPATDVQSSFSSPWPSTVFLDMWGNQENYGFASWPDHSLWTEDPELEGRGVVFGGDVGDTYGPGKVFKRTYPAGELVNLFGNDASDGTYLVFVCPLAQPIISKPSPVDTDVLPVSQIDTSTAVFQDRDYVFSQVGAYENACYYLRSDNDVKSLPSTNVQWSFRSPWPSTVYLDMWGGQETLGFASWPDKSSWTKDTDRSGNGITFHTSGPGDVYRRSYLAGEHVELFGNDAGSAGGTGTYVVFACPQWAERPLVSYPSGVIVTPATEAHKVYTDRDLNFSFTGGHDHDCHYLMGENDLKNTAAVDVQWRFSSSWPSKVFLHMWGGQENMGFASWTDRSSWTEDPDYSGHSAIFGTSGLQGGKVFRRSYPAGEEVELFGNAGGGTGTYLVYVCFDGGADASSSLPALGPHEVLGDGHLTSDGYESRAECPSGSFVVGCRTFPEQTGFALAPDAAGCTLRSKQRSNGALAIAACSLSGSTLGWASYTRVADIPPRSPHPWPKKEYRSSFKLCR